MQCEIRSRKFIRLEFLELISAKTFPLSNELNFWQVIHQISMNNFASSDAKDKNLRTIKQRGSSRYTFLKTFFAIRQKVRETSLVRDRSCCFIIISRFTRFKNTFAIINSLSDLVLRYSRFILSVQMKRDSYEHWQQHKQLETGDE